MKVKYCLFLFAFLVLPGFFHFFIRAVLAVQIVEAIDSNGRITLIVLYICCMVRQCVHPTVQVTVTRHHHHKAHTRIPAGFEGRLASKPPTTTLTAFKQQAWIMLLSLPKLSWKESILACLSLRWLEQKTSICLSALMRQSLKYVLEHRRSHWFYWNPKARFSVRVRNNSRLYF